MTGKVLPFPGCQHTSAAGPVPDVVEVLTKALRRAKKGEILGVGLCYVVGSTDIPSVGTNWAAGTADCNLMISGASNSSTAWCQLFWTVRTETATLVCSCVRIFRSIKGRAGE